MKLWLDYYNMKFEERSELDKLAYSKYFDDHYNDKFDETYTDGYADYLVDKDPVLTFNSFYGTELHMKYLTPLLRKKKLEKIEKKLKINNE